ncbi:MAG TPA: hypothetical protein VN441_15320 [Syntrophomonas sp.]|nr:hypothetical protein [Syntrophomonas sp.]
MKKRLWVCVLIVAILIPVLSVTALADTGPKPSVVVSFKGLEQESYSVTLLSDKDSTGPWSKSDRYETYYGDETIWEKFNTYSDADGFYFLGCFSDCSDTDTFKWTYYPPSTFKILIYFPEYDRFVVSAETYERYAFDSYYSVDATNLNIQSVTVANEEMSVKRTYDFSWEILSLLCRILATIAIELGIAWLFGFRTQKQILVIGLTNVVTQTILNTLLNVFNYHQGAFGFIFNYIWMELVVFIIEGVVYANLLHRYEANPERKIHPWLYAFTANVLSFAVGMLIAKWMPGIF